jgi:protein-S-isoprenylcysteine O-methyltransferase Ste14
MVLLWRIRDEEKLMQDEFRDEWADYKKRTCALIPFIY